MVPRKPFTQEHIGERAGWPEIQAGLRGPESYDELGILSPAQRRQLVQLARIEPGQEKPFINEVTGLIIGHRRRERCHAQESPAAVAESMRRLIDRVYAYSCDVGEYPHYVICELKPPLPATDWFERANEKLREKEQWVKGHRPQRLTEALIMHALALQKVAGAHSSYLVSNRKAMKDWLEIALDASGDRPGKNYFNQLMLPRAADGSVDLTGRPPALHY